MDINAKINWTPGMEITAQTFIGLDENLDFRQQLAIRAALSGQRMGLLPGAEFSCNGKFVKNKFEVERLRCLAVLPSGRLIHPDEEVAVPIPMLYGTEYYLTIGIGEGRDRLGQLQGVINAILEVLPLMFAFADEIE